VAVGYGGDALLEILFGESRKMETTQNVQIGYGKATFAQSSITIAGFIVDAPFVRTLASKKVAKAGRTMRIPVSDHPDIDGWLFSDQIPAADGTIFLIQTSNKRRGARVSDGSVFVRARKDGAALLITAHIPHDSRCTLQSHSHTVFSGSGDILGLDDLAEEGIEIPKQYAYAYMDTEEVAECYTVHTLRQAKVAAPAFEVHESADGSEVKLTVARAQRRMRIRR
jgi:hypothetical protein